MAPSSPKYSSMPHEGHSLLVQMIRWSSNGSQGCVAQGGGKPLFITVMKTLNPIKTATAQLLCYKLNDVLNVAVTLIPFAGAFSRPKPVEPRNAKDKKTDNTKKPVQPTTRRQCVTRPCAYPLIVEQCIKALRRV